MAELSKKAGNIHKGDQIAFRDSANKLCFGTVSGFGYEDYVPVLKIAEYPQLKVTVHQVETIINKCLTNRT